MSDRDRQRERLATPTPEWADVRLWPRVAYGSAPKHRPDLGLCLEWAGSRNDEGYGLLRFGGKVHRAHRLAFAVARGRFPHSGMDIDHLCRNSACVRITHLEEVTRGENERRGLRGYGARTLCRNGLHDITDPSNVAIRSDGRTCRPCLDESRRKYKAKRGMCPTCGKDLNRAYINHHVQMVHLVAGGPR